MTIYLYLQIVTVMRPTNPFFTTNRIPQEFFCDRENETETLIKEIVNGNNMLLMSPRRMGKTGLVNHCYEDKRIKDNFEVFFIDIYDTSSIKELTFRLGKEIYDRMSLVHKVKTRGFLDCLRSLRGELSYDPLIMAPRFVLSVGQIREPEMTLDEMLSYLEDLDKPCIIAIDEFQRIADYEENNVEAMLRTKIQRLTNVRFIFSGSERHLLSQMFSSHTRPFYQSAGVMELKAIEETNYIRFAQRLFHEYGKDISSEAVSAVYRMMDGYTYFIQRTLNHTFGESPEGWKVSDDEIPYRIDTLLDSESATFKNILAMLSLNQRLLLSAIARDRKAVNILSGEFVARHNLGVPSSVQSSARSLLKKQLISRAGNQYYIDDKFLELWLRKEAGVQLSSFGKNQYI